MLRRPCALDFFRVIMCTKAQGRMCNHMHLNVPKWLCALIFFPFAGIFWHVIDVFVLVEFGNLNSSWVLYENFFISSLDLSFSLVGN